MIHFKGKGIFPSSGLLPEYFGGPTKFAIWPPSTVTSTHAMKFTTLSAEVIVVAIDLRVGISFFVEPQPLPVVVDTAHPLVVNVTWAPSQSVNIWTDTLVVTTDQGKEVIMELNGAILTTVKDNTSESDTDCQPHPNPSQGSVSWCGDPLLQWRVVDEFGVVVAHVTADADGRVDWRGDQSGFYMAVPERTGKAIPFIVLK